MYKALSKGLAKLGEKYPEITKRFMSDVRGKLGIKEKELIALGIADGLRCVPCIHLHTANAMKNGATKEEIMEDAYVAIIMAGGRGFAYATHVLDALEALTANAAEKRS